MNKPQEAVSLLLWPAAHGDEDGYVMVMYDGVVIWVELVDGIYIYA